MHICLGAFLIFAAMNSNSTILFLNMGPMEILLILVFVLMFFGAESIPKIARGMGRGIRQIKDASNEIQKEITDSAKGSSKMEESISKEIKEIEDSIKNDIK